MKVAPLLLFLVAQLSAAEQLELGEAYVNRGDGRKAIPLLEKAVQDKALAEKDRARAEAALGLAHLQQKNPKKAQEHLERSIALDAGIEKTWLLLGMSYDQGGEAARAVEAYRRGIEALPASYKLWHEGGA